MSDAKWEFGSDFKFAKCQCSLTIKKTRFAMLQGTAIDSACAQAVPKKKGYLLSGIATENGHVWVQR